MEIVVDVRFGKDFLKVKAWMLETYYLRVFLNSRQLQIIHKVKIMVWNITRCSLCITKTTIDLENTNIADMTKMKLPVMSNITTKNRWSMSKPIARVQTLVRILTSLTLVLKVYDSLQWERWFFFFLRGGWIILESFLTLRCEVNSLSP